MKELFKICMDKSHPHANSNGPTLSKTLTLMTSHVVALSKSCSTLHEYCLQYISPNYISRSTKLDKGSTLDNGIHELMEGLEMIPYVLRLQSKWKSAQDGVDREFYVHKPYA